MSAQLGRNEPCPCGSGKKYKKCCLAKDQAEQREKANAPLARPHPFGQASSLLASSPLPETDEPEPSLASPLAEPLETEEPLETDAETAKWMSIWEHLETLEPTEQLAFVMGILEEEQDLEADIAFDLCSNLIDRLQADGRTAEAEALLDRVEALHPAAYQECRYFPYWRVVNALAQGRNPEAPLLQVAQDPNDTIDAFSALLDQVAFEGYGRELGLALDTLAKAAHASPEYAMSDEEMEEPALWTQLDLVLAGMEGADLTGPDAMERLTAAFRSVAPDMNLPPDQLLSLALHRIGHGPAPWTADDFAGGRMHPAQEQRLLLLTCEFHHELRTQGGWSAPRAELAREPIQILLIRTLERTIGFEPKTQGRGKKGKPARPTGSGGRSPLLPGRQQVLDLVEILCQDFYPRPHRLAAALMALPTLGRFLSGKGLITPEEANSFREDLAALKSRLLANLEQLGAEQSLLEKTAAALS